jgi:hypothetical protein
MGWARHGHTINGKRSPEHNSWHTMRSRCNNANDPAFYNYGGRGIKVCNRWDKFENFFEDMGEKPGEKYSLDRINCNGNYEPNNCRWATRFEQNRNRRSSVYIEINGKNQTVKEWALETGLNRQTIERRLKLGWSHFDAVMQPVIPGQKFKKT